MAHKLTGRVGQIGITMLSKKFHAIENKIVEGKNVNTFIDEIVEAKSELERLLDLVKASIMQSSGS